MHGVRCTALGCMFDLPMVKKPLKCNNNCNHVVYDSSGIDDSEEDEEDLPVQGPLPQEPEDGPWKKNESGIRKL